jgi:8-oxo-dGTP diphosphatase
MDFGETPHETLIREFHEETGLIPSVGGVVDVISFLPRPDLHVIQMIYEVEARGEPQVIEVDGSTVDVRWVPTAELAALETVLLVDHMTALRGW